MESSLQTKQEESIAYPQPIKKKMRQLIIRHQKPAESAQTEQPKLIENIVEEQPSFSHRPLMQPTVALHTLKFAKKLQQQQKQKSVSEASKLFSQHTQSIIQEKQQSEMENVLYNQEIEGPQLKIDKQNIAFKGPTGLIQTELIQVINNGSAAVHYEWARLKSEQDFKAGVVDSDERFFCHHKKNVIKPGEHLPFSFSFKSNVTGIFYEEWVLKCEPPLLDPLPRIKFTGQAVEQDPSIQWRDQLKCELDKVYVDENIGEIIEDIVGQVRTPTPPLPDLENPEVARYEFESKNSHLRLYYCPFVINLYKQLISDLCAHLNQEQEYWDLNIMFIRRLIDKVKDPEQKEFFEGRFDEFTQLATYLPLERRAVYRQTKEMIELMANELPNLANSVRRDLELWDYAFQEPQELSEEELAKKKAEEEKMKQEWLKKSKKKKWGEEEEKLAIQQYHEKLNAKCAECFAELLEHFDASAQYSKALSLMEQNERANYGYFRRLFRTKPLVDVDLDGRRVLLRVHFRLIKSEDAQEIKVEHEESIMRQEEEERKQEEARQEALRQEQQKQKQRKGGKKQQAVVAVEEKKQERTFDMGFLDQQNLEDIVRTIKFCVEHLAKLVIIAPSYDCPNGVYRERSNMRFFVDYLQSLLPETIINYNDQGFLIEEFADKMENDFYPENSLLVLENLFFYKEETGRVVDEQRNVQTLYYQDKLPFIKTLTEYSPLYVIEDKLNFLNSAVTSIKYVKPESVVLGLGMAEEIKALAYWFQVMKGNEAPFVALIGGNLSLQKLVAIDTLLNFCQVVWITGSIALHLILAKKEESQLCDVVLDGANAKLKEVVRKLFQKAKQKNVEIKFPVDLQVCEKQENLDLYSIDAYEYINENAKIFKTFGPPQDMVDKYNHEQELIRQQEEQEQLLREQQLKESKKGGKEQKDQKKEAKQDKEKEKDKSQEKPVVEKKRIEIPGWNEIPLESGVYSIIDWGPETLDQLQKTFSSQFKLLWIDSICPSPRTFPPVFNQSNKQVGTLLMGLQEKQRKLIQQEQLGHQYCQDSFVTLIGSELCEYLNGFELITEEEEQRRKELEEKKRRQQEAQEDADEEQQQFNSLQFRQKAVG